jgi:6-phosphogluconolactonase
MAQSGSEAILYRWHGGTRGMTEFLNIEVLETEQLVAQRAADIIAEEAKKAVPARGRFVMAVSDGHVPWLTLLALAAEDMPWPDVHIVQVDDRVAPTGHPDRKLTDLHDSLLTHAPLRAEQIHAMPVEDANLEIAAKNYAATLREIAGTPPILDLIQLSLGDDGHTASLVPGDPALNVNDADVAMTLEYHSRRRMTLTFPMVNRSRRILWVVGGEWKTEMLKRLVDGDETIPAGRVRRDQAVLLADQSVAGRVTVRNGKAT